MSRAVDRYYYNIRKLMEYAKTKGVKPMQLTEEDRMQFRLRKRSFGMETCWPLNREDTCYVCHKETKWVDKMFNVYLCSEECMDKVDSEYESGKEIEPNKEAVAILEQVAIDLFQ